MISWRVTAVVRRAADQDVPLSNLTQSLKSQTIREPFLLPITTCVSWQEFIVSPGRDVISSTLEKIKRRMADHFVLAHQSWRISPFHCWDTSALMDINDMSVYPARGCYESSEVRKCKRKYYLVYPVSCSVVEGWKHLQTLLHADHFKSDFILSSAHVFNYCS